MAVLLPTGLLPVSLIPFPLFGPRAGEPDTQHRAAGIRKGWRKFPSGVWTERRTAVGLGVGCFTRPFCPSSDRPGTLLYPGLERPDATTLRGPPPLPISLPDSTAP